MEGGRCVRRVGGPEGSFYSLLGCDVFRFASVPAGTAYSSSGGAGLIVSIQVRKANSTYAWSTVVEGSCGRFGGQLSKNSSCEVPTLYAGVRYGTEARVLCQWKTEYLVIDKNPHVACVLEWTYFNSGS